MWPRETGQTTNLTLWAEEFLLTNARGDVWGQLVTRRALTAITPLRVVANASSAQEGISLAFINICKKGKTPC